MEIIRPKIVSLDTATWGLIAKEQSLAVDRINRIFWSGAVVPFFMDTVIMELLAHGNDNVVKSRIAMIRRLPFVHFMKGCPGHAGVGWLLDLREAEMAVIRDFPNAKSEDVLNIVRSQVTSQFCAGAEFCDRYYSEWMNTRQLAPLFTSETPEIAAFTQFPLPGVNLRDKIPASSEEIDYRSFEEFENIVCGQHKWLTHKLKTNGDEKINDPEKAAAKFLREICDDMKGILDGRGDITEALLAQAGVERSRLPPKPTIDDVGFEYTFVGHLQTHERRLKLPQGTLKQFVRKEQLPSWIVWREVSRAIRRLPKAEASSLNDKMIVPFALYLDGVEVDKRIRNCIREASSTHPLMKITDAHVFRSKPLKALADHLESIAAS